MWVNFKALSRLFLSQLASIRLKHLSLFPSLILCFGAHSHTHTLSLPVSERREQWPQVTSPPPTTKKNIGALKRFFKGPFFTSLAFVAWLKIHGFWLRANSAFPEKSEASMSQSVNLPVDLLHYLPHELECVRVCVGRRPFYIWQITWNLNIFLFFLSFCLNNKKTYFEARNTK